MPMKIFICQHAENTEYHRSYKRISVTYC